MAIIDFIILFVLLISLLISVFRGFVKESISLGTWFAAAYIGLTFANKLASLMPASIAQPSLRIGISFAILFIVTMIIGTALKFLLGRFVDKTGLSSTDRAVGALFGLLRGVLIICIIIIIAELTPITQDSWWQSSVLIPHFAKLVAWLDPFLPNFIR